MTTVVLSVIGSDRPGLTRALAGAVLTAGGNWLESHLSQLGGLYVGSVLVELEAANVDALRSALREVDADGLDVRIAAAGAGETVSGSALRLSLVGQDRPGIVHQVTAALRDLGVNIEAFNTRMSEEAHSGAPLFNLDATLRLPTTLTVSQVQSRLEAISGEIMVDIALTAADET